MDKEKIGYGIGALAGAVLGELINIFLIRSENIQVYVMALCVIIAAYVGGEIAKRL